MHAAYLITARHGVYTAPCYWVQGERLALCEGDSLDLREVMSIDAGRLTPAEHAHQSEALRQFYDRVETLRNIEADLNAQQTAIQDTLAYIMGLHHAGKSAPRLDDAKDDAERVLTDIERQSMRLKDAWWDLKIPERDLVYIRDIKLLQQTARILASREWIRYLRTGDLTARAYAQEHTRQVQTFETGFQRQFEARKARDDAGGHAPWEDTIILEPPRP